MSPLLFTKMMDACAARLEKAALAIMALVAVS
jgi:hypothetical protein